jgi:hypothetical protein
MSWSYLFFKPTQVPQSPDDLGEENAFSFSEAAEVQAVLSAHLPHLTWAPDPEGVLARGRVTEDDAEYNFNVMFHEDPAKPDAPAGPAEAPKLVVGMHCSGRIDSASFVQCLCDATGWIALDDRVYLFQPHHAPVPGGGG